LPPDYRHLESDLVLQAPVRPTPGDKHRRLLLYILIEHQSEPDRLMPLRVLEYVVAVYKRQMRDWEKEHGNLDHFHFQPVLPIALYTGSRTWDKLGRLAELVELGDELAELIPEFQPLFLNVGQTSREVLERGSPFGLLLRLVQQRPTRLPVFEKSLREVVRALEGLADQDRQRWLELLSYIDALLYYEREPDEHEPLQQTVSDAVENDRHRQEVHNMAKTMAEHLMEKGEAKGRREEAVRTQRRLLLRLLQNRFPKMPERTVQRIEATEQLDLLDAWFDEAMTAKKLADLSFAAE
jgi:hypothetical protein